MHSEIALRTTHRVLRRRGAPARAGSGMRIACLALLAFAGLLGANPAAAALGGDTASVSSDAAQLGATAPAPRERGPAGAYVALESTLAASGTRVRQYVDAQGRVFAIAWDGPRKPDLRRLLGRYFERLATDPARARAAGHSSVILRAPDLVIEAGGHPRHFSGRAYIPAGVPDGLAIGEIR